MSNGSPIGWTGLRGSRGHAIPNSISADPRNYTTLNQLMKCDGGMQICQYPMGSLAQQQGVNKQRLSRGIVPEEEADAAAGKRGAGGVGGGVGSVKADRQSSSASSPKAIFSTSSSSLHTSSSTGWQRRLLLHLPLLGPPGLRLRLREKADAGEREEGSQNTPVPRPSSPPKILRSRCLVRLTKPVAMLGSGAAGALPWPLGTRPRSSPAMGFLVKVANAPVWRILHRRKPSLCPPLGSPPAATGGSVRGRARDGQRCWIRARDGPAEPVARYPPPCLRVRRRSAVEEVEPGRIPPADAAPAVARCLEPPPPLLLAARETACLRWIHKNWRGRGKWLDGVNGFVLGQKSIQRGYAWMEVIVRSIAFG
uniref:Uncharacterized protein n=1 Tax=Oryza glumipatula TaxID=40148 RepID=A0A0D9Y8V4_9ORYZ